jgi:hypothetical protein
VRIPELAESLLYVLPELERPVRKQSAPGSLNGVSQITVVDNPERPHPSISQMRRFSLELSIPTDEDFMAGLQNLKHRRIIEWGLRVARAHRDGGVGRISSVSSRNGRNRYTPYALENAPSAISRDDAADIARTAQMILDRLRSCDPITQREWILRLYQLGVAAHQVSARHSISPRRRG